MSGAYADCLQLLCCAWLLSAATRPRQPAVVYVRAPARYSPSGTLLPGVVGAGAGGVPLIVASLEMVREPRGGLERV